MTRRITLSLLIAVLLLVVSSAHGQQAAPGPTLAAIQARGELVCGVNEDLFGFGYLDPNTGEISGFDVDFCRALAVATLGDVDAARLMLHSLESGQAALLSGEIDILLHNVSETLLRDASAQLDFGPPNFYNSQTMMVAGDSGLDTWESLEGKTICTTSGEAAANLEKAIESRGLTVETRTFDTVEEAQEAFEAGRCDAHSADWIQLAALRRESDTPFAFTIWEEAMTLEPLGPVFRYGDEQWADIIEWTVYGLIRAEELGITSENIDQYQQGSDDDEQYAERVGVEIALLLGNNGLGGSLGLENNFMVEVIEEVGNYGEIFERHLGANTPLRLPRGLNALWRDGGLMYAPRWG